jgi:hypothetical protein
MYGNHRALITPAEVYYGRGQAVLDRREKIKSLKLSIPERGQDMFAIGIFLVLCYY